MARRNGFAKGAVKGADRIFVVEPVDRTEPPIARVTEPQDLREPLELKNQIAGNHAGKVLPLLDSRTRYWRYYLLVGPHPRWAYRTLGKRLLQVVKQNLPAKDRRAARGVGRQLFNRCWLDLRRQPSDRELKRLVGNFRSQYGAAAKRFWEYVQTGYDVKLESLGKLVGRIRKRRSAKVLVFCAHRAVATAVARYLDREMALPKGTTVDASRLSGVKLEEACDKFNELGTPPFILVTTDKLSETIDLHKSCDILVHFELPWSPLRVLQRVGRLWRIKNGRQSKPSRAPVVFHVIYPCSVEEEVLNRLNRRWHYLKALHLGYMPIKYGLGTRLPRVPWDVSEDIAAR